MDPLTLGLAITGATLAGGTLGTLFGKKPEQKLGMYEIMDPLQQAAYHRWLRYLLGRAARPVVRLGPWEEYSRKAFRRYQRAAERSFYGRALPKLREAYAGAGMLWSGARARAELDAARALARELAARKWELERQAIETYLATQPEASPAARLLLGALSMPTRGYWVRNEPGGPFYQLGQTLLGGGTNLGSSLLLMHLLK